MVGFNEDFVVQAMSATSFCYRIEQALNLLWTPFQGVADLGA